MSETGNIVLLNGTSSSGKSSIARALQDLLDEPYLHASSDLMRAMCPPALSSHHSDHRSERKEAFAPHRLLATLLPAVPSCFAALAAFGNHLIVDEVILVRELSRWVEAFAGFNVLFVGVRCALRELKRREQARGDRPPGTACDQFRLVHSHSIYDIEVDTTVNSAEDCARTIKARIVSGQESEAPKAFERLRQISLTDLWEQTMPKTQVLEFTNTEGRLVHLFWIGPYWEGRHFFRALLPGERIEQPYQGYGWEAQLADGTVVKTVETVY